MAFVSKDKLSQRYLLSKYAESMSGPVAFAYLDTPQLDATAYFCQECFFKDKLTTLYPINMPTIKELPVFDCMSEAIRTAGIGSGSARVMRKKEFGDQASSNLKTILQAHPQINDRVFPKQGDIVSVLYNKEHENMFDIIWLDWCATHKTVGTFNDFVKASFAFKHRQPSVLAVTLSTHAIADTLDGAVKIPGFKVLRYMNFLLNKATGIGFSIKTSTVYPGLDRDDVDETATRMVFLLGTTTKPLKIPSNIPRALSYGEHIGKRLLVPIHVFGDYHSQSPEFRKFLCVNEHIVARVYNGDGGRQTKDPFRYYLQFKPMCSNWYTEPPRLRPRSFSTEEILRYANVYNHVVTNQGLSLGLLCQAQAEGGAHITEVTRRAFSQIDSSPDTSETESVSGEKIRNRRVTRKLLRLASSDGTQLKAASS